MEFTIERAGPELAPAILALLVECGRDMVAHGFDNWNPPPATVDSIRTEAVEETVLVASTRERLAGTVTLRRVPTHSYDDDVLGGTVRWVSDGPAMYLNRLAVHPSLQRCGLGERLLEAAAAEARDAGAASLRFDALEGYRELLEWYRRRGCEPRGHRAHSGKRFVVLERAL